MKMKAVVLDRYGSPGEVLRLDEVERPVPGELQVLVRVRAVSVNDWDWSYARGRPWAFRPLFGWLAPRVRILGAEIAGEVAEVGAGVTQLQPGDRVYGDISEAGFGGFAEYVAVDASAVVAKPQRMTFAEAVSIPHAGMLAFQGLLEEGELQPKQRVLINGAGGGVGALGVQIAKQFDAEVTGVDSADKLDAMRALGFDHVIDYRRDDFTAGSDRYDLVLDTKTVRPMSHYRRVLTAGGRYVTVGGAVRRILAAVAMQKWRPQAGVRIVTIEPNRELAYFNELHGAGNLKCVIDGPYPFAETPSMVHYFGAGRHCGKVVIEVHEASGT